MLHSMVRELAVIVDNLQNLLAPHPSFEHEPRVLFELKEDAEYPDFPTLTFPSNSPANECLS